ncbi:hypothetical protein PC118_g7940 [Phytophthora cactorum]|uniref:Uncharacterized protein n=1 Tax=Phytophthora cactorum TaxID=29920 RepID=A0A8T1FZS8_9STRA|nr:hypothetical protein PC114_g21067 [Phytophthora cactorum]KAG2986177.1 hypothetical protein PC118_g7940 [Phytophthora cactorum]KAG3089055.1 hypothetical protein PC122_g8073 [Phytophthora cactorum]KAG3136456.1 hypothetical protein C6341_g21375 [Phytophthora cactorum]
MKPSSSAWMSAKSTSGTSTAAMLLTRASSESSSRTITLSPLWKAMREPPEGSDAMATTSPELDDAVEEPVVVEEVALAVDEAVDAVLEAAVVGTCVESIVGSASAGGG